MTYMQLLTGDARTHAPAVKVGSFETRQDARRIAEARSSHDYADSEGFRMHASLMRQRTGVCG